MAKGYWIVDATIHDPEAYAKYVEANGAVFKKWGATFLVRAGTHEIVEGQSHTRHVVIEFDSYQKARECYHSEEYQRVCAHRHGAADINVVIVEGV